MTWTWNTAPASAHRRDAARSIASVATSGIETASDGCSSDRAEPREEALGRVAHAPPRLVAASAVVVADPAEHAAHAGIAGRRGHRVEPGLGARAGIAHGREAAAQRLERGQLGAQVQASRIELDSSGTQMRRKISDGSPNASALPKHCVRW